MRAQSTHYAHTFLPRCTQTTHACTHACTQTHAMTYHSHTASHVEWPHPPLDALLPAPQTRAALNCSSYAESPKTATQISSPSNPKTAQISSPASPKTATQISSPAELKLESNAIGESVSQLDPRKNKLRAAPAKHKLSQQRTLTAIKESCELRWRSNDIGNQSARAWFAKKHQ